MTEKTHLILLPGLLCDRSMWRPQADSLADIAEIAVPDLSLDDSFPAMARRVLTEAPPRFALAGLSMGGYVAQEVMRQAPERVSRLALLDTSARADTPEQSRRRRDLIELSKRGQFHGVSTALMPNLIHHDRLGDEALTGIIVRMAAAIGAEGFRRQETAILARIDGRPDLARISVPTLVVVGRQDALTPLPLAEEMAVMIPGARLVVIEACGHMTTLERPETVNTAMRAWLRD